MGSWLSSQQKPPNRSLHMLRQPHTRLKHTTQEQMFKVYTQCAMRISKFRDELAGAFTETD